MPKKNNIYVKPQLCKEFGVTEKTLNHLTELKLINPDWQFRHGLPVVDLSDDDRFMLECAKNSPHNNHPFRVPFQRFLNLRFIQMPLEYVAFELEQKNLLDCSKYDSKYLKRRYEQFLANVPKDLRDCLEDYRPPKTAKEKKLFDALLDICEIRIAYEHPEWDEAFAFMNNKSIKIVVDASVSTLGSYDSVSDFLHDTLEVNFTPEGLLFYQQIFHDMELMTAEDIKTYYKGISPLHRQELQLAHGSPIEIYKLQSGLQADIKADEVLDIAINQICQKVIELTSDVSAADSEETYKAIRTFNMLMDRHTKIVDVARGTQADNVPKFFKTLKLAEQDVSHGKILLQSDAVEEEEEEPSKVD